MPFQIPTIRGSRITAPSASAISSGASIVSLRKARWFSGSCCSNPGSRIESLLLAEGRLNGLSDALALLPPEVPVYVANRAVMDAIVGFPIHRGVLAVARRAPLPPAEELLSRMPGSALVVGLIGLANHDNVGGIFRNAAAFGASAVLLDPETCDPLYRKAIRVSVGGALVVPFTRVPSVDAMVEALQAAAFEIIALSPLGRGDSLDRSGQPGGPPCSSEPKDPACRPACSPGPGPCPFP